MNDLEICLYSYYAQPHNDEELEEEEDDYEDHVICNVCHNGKRVESHEEEATRIARETKNMRTSETKDVNPSVDNAKTKSTHMDVETTKQGTKPNNTKKPSTPFAWKSNMAWMDVPLSNEYEAYKRPQWRKLYVPNATGKTFAT